MQPTASFVDIHCHLIPDIDDGARSWLESLAMAQIARDEGIQTIIVTPHQLGSFAHNRGDRIREAAGNLQEYLHEQGVELTILPGADVRVEPGMLEGLQSGDVLTLGDLSRHVLLELPHELYISLDTCLDDLSRMGLVGILSHPERNFGLLRRPELIGSLVEHGCLMQVTAGSLTGVFGTAAQALAERMLEEGWAHFLATDAHGARARRPLIRRAFTRVAEIAGEQAAYEIACRNPALVADGQTVPVEVHRPKRRLPRWLSLRRAA